MAAVDGTRVWRSAFAGLAASAAGFGLLVTAPSPAAGEDVQHGQEIYRELCAECHRRDMTGTGAARLDLTHFPLDQRERFEQVVTRGQGLMPPVGRELADDELDTLWAFFVDARGGGAD